MPKYYKPNNSTILYLNSSYNCIKAQSITINKVSGGSGYTSSPTIIITPASNDAGSGASATCALTTGSISSITMTNGGMNYNKLPTISLSGGGTPGVITGYSGLTGGTGYQKAPTVSFTGGGGSGATATATLTPTTLATPTITTAGTGYLTGQTLNFIGGGGSGAVGTITATAGVITAVNISNAGSGYTSPPTITINTVSGTGGVLTAVLTATSVASITITNGGSNYTSAPTIVFTPTLGGSGASATPTLNAGSAAVLTASFNKSYLYTWNIPDIVINDLAKISAINIISTNFNTSTPYTFRIVGLQYDTRDSFFSDYGNPILSMAQNVNVCSYGSLGGTNFCIILVPQTIKQIQIQVDDDITNMGSGMLSNINFVIALEIEEYDPVFTEVGDVYGEASSRLKSFYP